MAGRTRFLVTGATGQVGLPVAVALADIPDHEVVAVARFRDAGQARGARRARVSPVSKPTSPKERSKVCRPTSTTSATSRS